MDMKSADVVCRQYDKKTRGVIQLRIPLYSSKTNMTLENAALANTTLEKTSEDD